jgi:hypothetical protein
VAAGTTTFFAALATPLAALLPTSFARSVRLPLREAAVRERDDARACGRELERDRELRRLDAGRLLELGLARELVGRDEPLRPDEADEPRLDELPLDPPLAAARLVC